MVQHTHGEHGVEALQLGWQLLKGQWQVPHWLIRQVALHRQELAEEQPVGVDADHAVCARTEHAPHVVAVAATDIEDAFAGQVQVRGDALPFPVRAPFGVDVYAEQLERPLAPGNQALQSGFQLRAGGVIAGAAEGEALQQLHLTHR